MGAEKSKGLKDFLVFIKKNLLKVWAFVKKWVIINIIFFLTLWVFFFFKFLKPKKGEPDYIGRFSISDQQKFTLDVSNTFHAGVTPNGTSYSENGQYSEWVDTGFETNGKELEIFVYNSWYPWGKANSKKSNGEDRICTLNTKFCPKVWENNESKYKEMNHFNSYGNSNLKEIDSNDPNSIIFNNGCIESDDIILQSQADCISGMNCTKDERDNPTDQYCRLDNGAGVYMKIGEEQRFAYSLNNPSVPILKRECDPFDPKNENKCKYNFLEKDGEIVFEQIPFTLPVKIFHTSFNTDFIKDISSSLDFEMIDANKQIKKTFKTSEKIYIPVNYDFTII